MIKFRHALGITLVLQSVAMLCGIGFQVLSARWLGVAARGQFALLVAGGQVAASVIGLGLPGAISFYAASRPDSIPLLARRELVLLLATFGASGAALVANRLLFPDSMLIGAGVWFGIYVVGSVGQPAFASLALASGAVVVSNLTTVAAAAGSLLLVLAFGLSGPLSASAAFGSLATATVLGAALGVADAARRGLFEKPTIREPTWGAQVRIGGAAFMSSILALLMFRADIFLLAALGGGARAAGLYSVGVLAAELLVRIPTWTATILAPAVSARPTDARRITVRLFWLSLLFIVLAASPIVLLPSATRWLLGTVVGPDFVDSYVVLVLMVPRAIAQAGGAILFGNLAGKGYSFYHPLACGVGLCLLCGVDLLLVPRLGMVGAAVGSVIGYLGATLVAFKGFLVLNESTAREFGVESVAEVVRWRRGLRMRLGRLLA